MSLGERDRTLIEGNGVSIFIARYNGKKIRMDSLSKDGRYDVALKGTVLFRGVEKDTMIEKLDDLVGRKAGGDNPFNSVYDVSDFQIKGGR